MFFCPPYICVHPRDLAEGLDTINVVYADELLPTLYENSRISQNQLLTHRELVRHVVALGRYLQNPLAMVATLCSPSKELLSLKLHSLEHFLTPDEKYEAVKQVMVIATNCRGYEATCLYKCYWFF